MMLKSQIKLSVFILFIWLFSACQDRHEEWILFTTNLDNGDKIFYANESIIKQSSDIISIKTKIVLSQQTKDMIIASAKENMPRRYQQYKNIKYSIQLNEVDCKNNMLKLVSFEDYDGEGLLIHSETRLKKWLDIPPDSLYKQIYNLVCTVQ